MKILMGVVFILIILLTVYFFVLAVQSKSGKAAGVVLDQLSHCPDTPNCISSEFKDDEAHYIEPIKLIVVDRQKVMNVLKQTIEEMDGQIVVEHKLYLSAIFTSSLMGFTDDFETRLDIDHQLVHIRSASRVGKSDLGVNRKRVREFKHKFDSMLEPD